MLEQDIYTRRFNEKAGRLKNVEPCPESTIEKYRLGSYTPALAVSEYYGKMRVKTKDAEKKFKVILDVVCEVYGFDPDGITDGDSMDWRDVKSISCVIAVLDQNIRPHTVIRKALYLKYNSMVNHYVDRSKKREDRIAYHNNLAASRAAITSTSDV